MPSSTSMDMIELMGGSPVPMASGETYSSLQQGIVDGAENTELALTVDGHQDLVKSYTYTEHQYSPDIYIISTKTWNKMTPEQQELLTQVIREAVEQNNQDVMAEEAKILDECVEKYGINLQEPDKDAFKEYAFKYYLSNPDNEKNWNMDIFNEITK